MPQLDPQDAQFVKYLRDLAEAQSYQARGVALYILENLARKNDLARRFVRTVPLLDGSDGFAAAHWRAKQVMKNLQDDLNAHSAEAES